MPERSDHSSSIDGVLVYSRTTGYRHESIADGVAAMERLGVEHGFAVRATEDRNELADLRAYRCVVFLNTSGDVLEDGERAQLERFVRAGGGFVGVHCAAYTECGWPFFGSLVGARFDRHPPVARATIQVEERNHPATAHLGEVWERVDEWYEFHTDPRPAVHVLLSLGPDQPLAWCHENEGGRAFYTALGHTSESYVEPDFVAHLLGGVSYALGR